MERSQFTRVMVGDCRCPGSPHPEDWVELASQTPIEVGAAIYQAIRSAGNDELLLEGLMSRAYVTFGICRWSFVEQDGEDTSPVPVDVGKPGWPDVVRRWLPWGQGGFEVSEKANELYSGDILRPLLSRTSKSSQGGQMDGSTSPTQPTGQSPRKPSGRSSRTKSAGKPSGDPAP